MLSEERFIIRLTLHLGGRVWEQGESRTDGEFAKYQDKEVERSRGLTGGRGSSGVLLKKRTNTG